MRSTEPLYRYESSTSGRAGRVVPGRTAAEARPGGWWWGFGLAGLLVILAVGIAWVRRPPVPPEEAVSTSVRSLIEELEYGRINRVIRALDPSFTFNGYGRGDISRGLVMHQRELHDLTISLLDLAVWVEPDGQHATAHLSVALSFFRDGREQVLGDEHPIALQFTYRREGRHWVPIAGSGDGRIETLGGVW